MIKTTLEQGCRHPKKKAEKSLENIPANNIDKLVKAVVRDGNSATAHVVPLALRSSIKLQPSRTLLLFLGLLFVYSNYLFTTTHSR